MVCAGLQKCSATPDLSSFLLIMSHRCSLNLSLSPLLVCPMYWQFLFPLCRQRLHCNAHMTLVEQNSEDTLTFYGFNFLALVQTPYLKIYAIVLATHVII